MREILWYICASEYHVVRFQDNIGEVYIFNVCIYAFMYLCIHVFMHLCIYAFMHLCMHAFMYVCIYVFLYLCTYTLMYSYIHIFIIHAFMHSCIHVLMSLQWYRAMLFSVRTWGLQVHQTLILVVSQYWHFEQLVTNLCLVMSMCHVCTSLVVSFVIVWRQIFKQTWWRNWWILTS